jgi:hypothetical protein
MEVKKTRTLEQHKGAAPKVQTHLKLALGSSDSIRKWHLQSSLAHQNLHA